MTSIPAPPETIGRYEVIRELGRGSMGVVLLAHDPVLKREVAIKYLRPDLELGDADRNQLLKRMRQEAQAIARVTHPGIVSLHDIGESSDAGLYLVFERATGPTLEEAVRRGRLTKDGIARLAKELGEALEAAHNQAILHRDIKPGNVILTERGSKIADFGVARLPDSTLTRAGARVGTPAYSAPECIRAGDHSALSDQFAMAACLYEGLSGRRAYPGKEAVEVARRIQKETPLPIAGALGLGDRVDEVLMRGMAHEPANRYSSCRELGIALSDALIGVRERQPTLPDESILLRHDAQQRSRAIGFAILFALCGAIVGVGAMRLGNRFESSEKQHEMLKDGSPLGPPLRAGYLSPRSAGKN